MSDPEKPADTTESAQPAGMIDSENATTEPDTAEPDTTEPDKAERRGARATPRTIAVAALLAVAVGSAVTFGVLLVKQTASDRAGSEALATARAYAVTVTSYDYQNLDRNFADVLDGATGEFKDQYGGASEALRKLISDAKATSKGTVLAAGIQQASPQEVQVLVFVDQTITNSAAPAPRLDRNRVLMTLTPHDGRWLVDKLELE